MNLKEQISADLKIALKNGAEGRRNTLRLLLAAFRQAELDKRGATAKQMGKADDLSAAQLAELDQVSLDEAELQNTLQKEAKSRREALAEARSANRADLVAEAEAELAIIDSYLPQALTRAEIADLARAAIAEAGARDAKQIGAVMKLLTPRTKGRADGRLVNDVVRELLAG